MRKPKKLRPLTVETLVAAIRIADSLDDLYHLIGPTEEEVKQAQERINTMERIAPNCHWDQYFPVTQELEQARSQWLRLANQQSDFENRYF